MFCRCVCVILCAHSVAGVVESVDTTDLKSVADKRRRGSSPLSGTIFLQRKVAPTETHKKTAQSSHSGAIFLFYKHPSAHSHPNQPEGCFAIYRELRKSCKGRASRTLWHFVPRDAAFALFCRGSRRPCTPRWQGHTQSRLTAKALPGECFARRRGGSAAALPGVGAQRLSARLAQGVRRSR